MRGEKPRAYVAQELGQKVLERGILRDDGRDVVWGRAEPLDGLAAQWAGVVRVRNAPVVAFDVEGVPAREPHRAPMEHRVEADGAIVALAVREFHDPTSRGA